MSKFPVQLQYEPGQMYRGQYYSRDEALVHASVGFDARCHVIILFLVIIKTLVQGVFDGGCLVERGVHLHEVWQELHCDASPQVGFFIDVKQMKVFFTPLFIQDWYE